MTQISPTALRGIVSSAAAIAFTLGPFVVALIVKGTGTGSMLLFGRIEDLWLPC